MAVSLKKPVKVDLSKPELPPKVREYTPVHLLDEEETIKKPVTETDKLSARSSAPINQVDLEGDTDLLHFRHFRFSRGLIISFCVLGSLGLCLFLVSLLFTLLDLLPTDGAEGDLVSIMRSVFTHPIVIIGISFGCVGCAVRCVRKG